MASAKKKKRIIVNAIHPEECRVAILSGDELEDIHVETTAHEQTRGNIYKAVVVRVEPGLQAAFVEFEKGKKHGFLQFRDIRSEYYQKPAKPDGARPKIQDVIKKKQELLVQVEKDARDLKGASLTTYISLPGRYMVMMPGQARHGISRKIEGGENRSRLRDVLARIGMPDDAGFIVRTSAMEQDEDTLRADLEYLTGLWKEIGRLADEAKAPCLVYQEEDIVIRAIRDYLTDDVSEILIDNADVARRARDYFRIHVPAFEGRVKQHRLRKPIFSRFSVEEQVARIHDHSVALPSGGSIVIDSGEALTAIDVNSGKTRGEKDLEDLALRTNLEAAREIARQLRLRDMGGLIVIDFIDMRPMKNRRAVEQALRDALKQDKARTDTARISKFGMLEMSRQRLRPSLDATNFETCATCRGLGRYRSAEALALLTLRELQALGDTEHLLRLRAELPAPAADYLLNVKREDLLDLEKRTSAVVQVRTGDVLPGQYHIVVERDGAAPEVHDSRPPTDEATGAKRKKRSRRRKKSKATPATEADAAAAAPTDAVAETGDDAKDEAPGGEETGNGRRKKSRRRRGGRRHKKAAAGGDSAPASAPESTSETTQDGADAPTKAAVTEAEPPATKKSRTRKPRSRRRKAPAEPPAPEPEASAGTGEVPPPTAGVDGPADAATRPKSAKKKSRRKTTSRRRTASSRTASAVQKTGAGKDGDGTTSDH